MDSEGLLVRDQEDGRHGVDREADPEVGAAGHEAEVDSDEFRGIYFPWKFLTIPFQDCFSLKLVHKRYQGIIFFTCLIVNLTF